MKKTIWVQAFVGMVILGGPGTGYSQESTSAPIAEELAQLMADKQLDAIAAKDTVDDDRFVAALAFPTQLLVVSARYQVPMLLLQKIQNGDYREVYIDLNAASIAGSKVLVTDLGGDGLYADNDTVDVFATNDMTLRLDGDRNGRQMSGDDYRAAATEADAQYTRMLQALVAQLR